jgi:hypothetical protein
MNFEITNYLARKLINRNLIVKSITIFIVTKSLYIPRLREIFLFLVIFNIGDFVVSFFEKEFKEKFNKPGQLIWSRLGDHWSNPTIKHLESEIKNNSTKIKPLQERAKHVKNEFETHLNAFKTRISSKKRKPILIYVDNKEIPINLQNALVEKQDIFAMQGRFVGNHALNTRFEQETRLAINWIAFVECLTAKKRVPPALLQDLEDILESFLVNEKTLLTFMSQIRQLNLEKAGRETEEKNNLINFIGQNLGERDIVYNKLLKLIQTYKTKKRIEIDDFLELLQSLNRNSL